MRRLKNRTDPIGTRNRTRDTGCGTGRDRGGHPDTNTTSDRGARRRERYIDLVTSYLGLALHNPIIASASPLSRDVGVIRQLEDSGPAAVVLPSLFEEQIRRDEELLEVPTSVGIESNPEAS